jgi:hypothetical protein
MSARHPQTTNTTLKNKAINRLNNTDFQVAKITNYQLPAPPQPQTVQGGGTVPGGGTTFPILYPIAELGDQSGSSIDINLGAQTVHYQKLVLDYAGDVTITFSGLVQNRAIIFTLDITVGVDGLGTITWPSNLNNIPDDLPTTSGSRYLLTIIGFYDTAEERYEVVGGSSSGGSSLWSGITIDVNKDMEMMDLYNLSLIQFDTDYDSKLRQIKGLHDVGMTFDLGATGAEVTDEYYYFKINGNEVIRFENDAVLFSQALAPNGIGVPIGNDTIPFSDLFALEVHIGGIQDNLLQADSDDNVLFSVPTGINYIWEINNTEVLLLTDSDLVGSTLDATFQSVTIQDNLFLNNVGVDPVSNGMFALNGSDVKIYSGGQVRDISTLVNNPLSADLNFNDHRATNVTEVEFEVGEPVDSANFSITVPASDMTFNAPNPATDAFSFQFDGVEYLRIEDDLIYSTNSGNLGSSANPFGDLFIAYIDFYDAITPHGSAYWNGTLNMNDNVIENIQKLEVEVGGTVLGGEFSITTPVSFMTFNVPNFGSDGFSFQFDGVEALRIEGGQILPIESTSLGSTSFPFAATFTDILNVYTEINPLDGAYWNGVLDMHSNNITNVADLFLSLLEFVNDSTITDNSLGMVFNVPTGKSYEWNVNNTPLLQLNYNYGSGPSFALSLTGILFEIITTETGNPLQIQKLSGDAAEFIAVEGFQFDNSVYLKENMEFLSPFTTGNYVDQFWDFSFFFMNMIEDSDSNYGLVFELNNTPYLQIIHNSASNPTDFLYAEVPLWIYGNSSGKGQYIQFNEYAEGEGPFPPYGSLPPTNNISLYATVNSITGKEQINAVFSSGAVVAVATHP